MMPGLNFLIVGLELHDFRVDFLMAGLTFL